MKLEKAKEIVELNIKEAGNKMPPDCRDALKLENEATKRILDARSGFTLDIAALLPGED